MRSPLAAVLTVTAILLSDASAFAQRGRRGGGFDGFRNGWQFSLRTGKELARQTGKPLMVVIRCQP
jgi:hypothetical protein